MTKPIATIAKTENGKPTVRAVIAHADQMRARADALMIADPWARPYYPATATAYKAVQTAAGQITREVRDRMPGYPEGDILAAIEEAKKDAPARAIEILDFRWARAMIKHREDNERGDRAQARHERHQRRAVRDRDARRAELTAGQRIDIALSSLSVIGAPSAASVGSEPVTDGGGSKDDSNPVPRFPGDPAAKARAIARNAVREIEEELDDAERRRLAFERQQAA